MNTTTICQLFIVSFLIAGCQSSDRPPHSSMVDHPTETDAERLVTLRIKEALSEDIFLSSEAKNIKVSTYQGAVTLSGWAESEKEKEQVLKKVSRINGVKSIVDKLGVSPEGSTADKVASAASSAVNAVASSAENLVEDEPEQAISRRVRQVIQDDSSLSSNARNIKVSTSKGVVTLRGYVRNEKERGLVIRKANQVPGVSSIDDKLQIASDSPSTSASEKVKSTLSSAGEAIKSRASSAASSTASAIENIVENEEEKAISRRVRDAIASDSAFSAAAKQIKVSTSKGVVTLRGTVANEGERTALLRKVRQTQGVKDVDDRIDSE